MPRKKTKFFSSVDENVDNAIMEEKALPEVRYKLDIFKAMTSMIASEQRMRLNMRMNGGIVNPNDKALFETELVRLLSYIKYMVLAQKKVVSLDNPVYKELVDMEYGKKNFGISELTDMKNFLLSKLHELQLTNLLIKEQDPFKLFEVWNKDGCW